MTTATETTALTPELLAELRTLSPADKDLPRDLPDEVEEGMHTPLPQEWKDEIRRRIEAYQRGEGLNHTADEVMRYLRERQEARRA